MFRAGDQGDVRACHIVYPPVAAPRQSRMMRGVGGDGVRGIAFPSQGGVVGLREGTMRVDGEPFCKVHG